MANWTEKEMNIVAWVIQNISVLSVDTVHRTVLADMQQRPLKRINDYTAEERMALAAALDYFSELYQTSIKGYPNGNRTVRSIKERIDIMKSARLRVLGTRRISGSEKKAEKDEELRAAENIFPTEES